MCYVDITVVVNCHREGLIVIPTLQSADRCARHARSLGFKVEIVIVLDRADSLTTEVVERWCDETVQVAVTDFGDPGLARNKATSLAKGRLIAFLDGDDLWGENWLSAVLASNRSDSRNIVWHPEVSLYFGRERRVLRHLDMENEEFALFGLSTANYWTALHVSYRDFLLDVPYIATGPVGYEDWDWNVAAVEHGAVHKVVRQTGHAIRIKSVSRLRSSSAGNAALMPTFVFREELKKFIRTKAKKVDHSILNGRLPR